MRKKLFAAASAAAVALLFGCAVTEQMVTPKVDTMTGSTIEQRCVGYRKDLALAQGVRAMLQDPDAIAAADKAIAAAKLALTTNCPSVAAPAAEAEAAK